MSYKQTKFGVCKVSARSEIYVGPQRKATTSVWEGEEVLKGSGNSVEDWKPNRS